MERTERNEKDDTQKAKLIFLSLAAVVVVLLIVSFGYANKARTELNAKKLELETARQDNAQLEQLLKDQSQEIDTLKKEVAQLQAKAKAKPKATVKKKAAPAKKSGAKVKKKTR